MVVWISSLDGSIKLCLRGFFVFVVGILMIVLRVEEEIFLCEFGLFENILKIFERIF